MAGVRKGNFIYRNAVYIKSIARVTFGFVWLIDAYFKFQPGFAQNFSNLIQAGGQGQPAWLAPWFSFWVNFTSMNPAARWTIFYIDIRFLLSAMPCISQNLLNLLHA